VDDDDDSSQGTPLTLGQLLSTGNEVVQLSSVLPELGSLCVRRAKPARQHCPDLTSLSRTERAMVAKATFACKPPPRRSTAYSLPTVRIF
jgi:hypothetical protein